MKIFFKFNKQNYNNLNKLISNKLLQIYNYKNLRKTYTKRIKNS